MGIIWRWLLRPAIIIVLGAKGIETVSENPDAAWPVGLVCLVLILWMFASIFNDLMTWGFI